MCGSNNYIELQAEKMTEEIRKQSVYKFVGLEYFNGESEIQIQQTRYENTILLKKEGLISKISLEDKNGTLYTIEPNANGLRFAQGQISYSKYIKLQRKNDATMFISFFGIIGFFFVSMFLLSKLI